MNAAGAPEADLAPDEVPPEAPATQLRTFLIADIRGYTAYTREHGDEAAAALATRFGELVGEVAATRDGFLLELRGDEALVVFVSARKALRAAIDLQARIAEEKLPRGIGIGLDAGEAIPVGAGFRGTSLNLAARLCAKAGAGETLASEAVIHLAAKMEGIEYVDAHEVRLKGYDDAVRVVVVVPAEKAKGRRTGSARRLFRRGPAQYGVLAVAVVIVALVATSVGGYLFGAAQPSPATAATPSPTPDPLGAAALPLVAFYDPTTGALKATTHLGRPRNISFYVDGAFWILSENPPAMNRIDPVTHEIKLSIPISINAPNGYSMDDDYLWITDLTRPEITRIDHRTGVSQTFTFADPKNPDDQAVAVDITSGADSVWLSRPDAPDGGEITRIDRLTGKVQKRIPVSPFGLTFGAGSLWWWREGNLGRIDPVTNEEAFEPVTLSTETWLGNLYIGGGDVWTTAVSTGQVWRVDRSGRSTQYSLPPGGSEFAATEKTMWVTNASTGELLGIDFATGKQDRTIKTGHATVAVSASPNELMVAVEPTVDEYIAALGGSGLSLALDGVPWWDPAPDPAVVGNAEARQLLSITCAGLLGYADKPGAEGTQLIPEVATSMPTVSGDGRTYTFTIRPGFKFSPPSNEEVTARTFKYTLERALSPEYDDGAPGPNIFGDIVGVKEYREGSADDVSGIVATSNQLSITLEAPRPDLPARLASSFACPVPLTTPPLRSGLNPNPPVGGDGPYYLAQRIAKWLVVFEKNPNYAGTRPQPFDWIAIRTKTSAANAIAMVQEGKIDGAILGWGNPLGGPGTALASEWGPGGEHAQQGDQRWFGAPDTGGDYVVLNPTSGALKDPDVRRAVSLALDREALARIFVEAPTDRLLPPSVPGSDPDPSPKAPDVEAAKALIAGRQVNLTLLGYPEDWGCGACRDLDVAIVGQLQKVGITVTIHPASDPGNYPGTAFGDDDGVDMYVTGMGTDVPDPVRFMDDLLFNAWLGDANHAALDHLDTLTGQERVGGAAAFAQRIVEKDALILPFGHGVFPFFMSERIGCGFVQPAMRTLDLLSLCVKDAGPATASPAASP